MATGLTASRSVTRNCGKQINPSAVAWGPPDKDGLSLGADLSPNKNAYALGERVRLLLFVCNVGDKNVEVVWANTTHPAPDEFAVTDAKGATVKVRMGHPDWLIPWISGFIGGTEFGPGDVHRLVVPYEIGIGGDGSNKRVGRVIDARVGQTLQLKVSSPNGNAARTATDPAPVSASSRLRSQSRTARRRTEPFGPWRQVSPLRTFAPLCLRVRDQGRLLATCVRPRSTYQSPSTAASVSRIAIRISHE